MQLFKQIERLNLLDKLISQKRTGKPENLARRLDLSVSRLARIIEYLRETGAPIQYDRASQTYFYEFEYRIFIQVSMQPLSDTDSRLYEAGCIDDYGHFSNLNLGGNYFSSFLNSIFKNLK
ncbi:hypothetical protein [Sphingobacterium sp. LRF_L2]|uniref:hypothetical protein n=1 Tax=Sphingobacterium sp. LRF_L2 TaxID=3369421 RepID=UPI003F6306D8